MIDVRKFYINDKGKQVYGVFDENGACLFASVSITLCNKLRDELNEALKGCED